MYNKNSENIIIGKNSIIEAYKSKRGFKKVWVLKGLKDNRINEIIDDLKSKGTVIEFKEREYLDKLIDDKSNQGIIAEVEDYKYYDIDDIFEYANEKNEKPFIIMLDSIEDPHNFGAIIRTAECVGAHGIIIKNREQVAVTSTVVQTSAGASNYVRIVKVTNLSKTIDDLKKRNIWFACADMNGTEMYNVDLKGNICLVVGNEGDGVSRLVKEKCDFLVKIPQKGNIDSLNVSVATGVLLYEIYKQRM